MFKQVEPCPRPAGEMSWSKKLFKDRYRVTVRKLVLVCQLFGTMPWFLCLFQGDRIAQKKLHWHQRFLRYLNVLYAVAVTLAIATASFLQQTEFDWRMPFMTRVLYMSEYISVNAIIIVVLFSCQYQRINYAMFSESLLEISVAVCRCGGTTAFERIGTVIGRLLGGTFAFFGAVMAIDFLYNDLHVLNSLRSCTVYVLPNVINLLALVQYNFLMYFIYRTFRTINQILKCWSRRMKCDVRTVLELSDGETVHLGPSDSCGTAIDTLRKIHLKLNKVIERVNRSFGVLLVSTIVASFVVLSLQLFAIYQHVNVERWTTTDTYLLIYTLLWIVLHMAKIALILVPSQVAQSERDRTGPVLYKFEGNHLTASIHDALNKFSMQLMHEKGQQTACGVVHLDMTLISTMVGALTTYLVILIQFDTAVNQGQGPKATATDQQLQH